MTFNSKVALMISNLHCYLHFISSQYVTNNNKKDFRLQVERLVERIFDLGLGHHGYNIDLKLNIQLQIISNLCANYKHQLSITR